MCVLVYCHVLYSTALYCTLLDYTILYHTTPYVHKITVQCTALYCTIIVFLFLILLPSFTHSHSSFLCTILTAFNSSINAVLINAVLYFLPAARTKQRANVLPVSFGVRDYECLRAYLHRHPPPTGLGLRLRYDIVHQG